MAASSGGMALFKTRDEAERNAQTINKESFDSQEFTEEPRDEWFHSLQNAKNYKKGVNKFNKVTKQWVPESPRTLSA